MAIAIYWLLRTHIDLSSHILIAVATIKTKKSDAKIIHINEIRRFDRQCYAMDALILRFDRMELGKNNLITMKFNSEKKSSGNREYAITEITNMHFVRIVKLA